jgi:hypothetical protein
MSAPFQSPTSQATAAGKLVFHFAPAWIETQILALVYPKDPVKALEMLINLMQVDQLISQQVREAQMSRAQRGTVGLPQAGLPSLPSNPSLPTVPVTAGKEVF